MSIERVPSKPETTSGDHLAEETLGPGRSSIPIIFAGLALTLDHSGAAWLSAERTLIVSDLHLEKGSNAAARGRLIPALDSHDTLARLRPVVEAYQPARVVCLGDSFHDGRAGERMAEADRRLGIAARFYRTNGLYYRRHGCARPRPRKRDTR